ncbi:SsDNA binding protein Ssb3 [Rasamsonia emersonii CBS 393.64]|uniref:SsDNA binding protein Ssb3 n=1 Tax=Rasamsonia emersonii (strain ATCC 16479 / CBS 393.64 / IMI 116815) TaxID=1408163 RepID=A0A0F4YXD9_RASE3|nr:SsDNA binding protein Ssb3 [Rasamsonia emersonii CBS 393.64]KKA22745.1 SsDNA binding protein Ssb3 [Rasamsonia emersonii CBS 393.64]
MSLQTPRVLPSHLHAFHPSSSGGGPRPSTQTVRLLGTVTALRGETATITCGNHGDVTLLLKPDSHLQMGKLVEVVGKVTELDGGQVSWRIFEHVQHRKQGRKKSLTWTYFLQGLGLRVLGSIDWGNPANCDYKIYEYVVDATHRHKEIFYDAGY